jgi:sugar (pentulose or hexulose) kinase
MGMPRERAGASREGLKKELDLSFLGIDIGTSFIKGAVLDLDRARFRHVIRIPFPEPISGLDPLFSEYRPADILNAVETMIRGLAEYAENCEGLVMCSQMSSTVMMDGNGAAASNCIGWRDQRSLQDHPSGQGSYYDIFRQRISDAQRRALGNEMPVGAPACFLFWMAEQKRKTPGLVPVSLGNFVLRMLCHSAAGEEATNAMAFGLLDLTTMRWHAEVIAHLGLDRYAWAALVPMGEILGYFSFDGKRIPCYAPMGDYQCALAGAMLEEADLSLNISTGSQVTRVTPTLELGDYQSRPFVDGRFTNTVSHLPAGRSLNVLVDLLTELGRRSGVVVPDPWRWIAEATESGSDTDLEVNTSFFLGPAGSRGAISNIGEKNLTVGTLFLAALENMAHNYWSAAERVWPDRSWQRIILTGGLANKLPALRRAIQKTFNREPLLCHGTEETLSGLLLLAMHVGGRAPSWEHAMQELRPQLGRLHETAAKLDGMRQ